MELEKASTLHFNNNVKPKKDIIGEIFGYLTILELVGKCEENKSRVVYYKAKCICGNLLVVSSQDLFKGDTKSCGCFKKESSSNDLRNMRFGKLTALYTIVRKERNKSKSNYWYCLCDCGTYHTVSSHSLLTGSVTSCGCSLVEKQQDNFDKVSAMGMIGYLEPIKLLPSGRVLCLCHGCNNTVERKANSLITKEIKSCGCKENELKSKAAGGTGRTGEVVLLKRIIREYISNKWTKKLKDLYGIEGTSSYIIHHLNTVSNILNTFNLKISNDYLSLYEDIKKQLKEELLDYSNGIALPIEWHKQLHRELGHNHTKEQSLVWINNKRKENNLDFLSWNSLTKKYE